MDIDVLDKSLNAILGQFTPTNMGARLFMLKNDLEDMNNFLVFFHERFHYLQMIFTSYGQLKWGAYRTNSMSIIELLVKLTNDFGVPVKIPIKEYLEEGTEEGIKIAYNISVQELKYKIYKVIEYGSNSTKASKYFKSIIKAGNPEIYLNEVKYNFRVIDIIESFAKFEEAMLGKMVTGKNLNELIDTNKLNLEYYLALHYFIEKVGVERLFEFPVVCELSLMCAHIPSAVSIENLKKYAPNWRFIKIIDVIKDPIDLPNIELYNDKSFRDYCDYVLKKCDYESISESWEAAREYANSCDLTMSQEMIRAIDYKMSHPWMLTYPMKNHFSFMSEEFNNFQPYFTITNDEIFYNTSFIEISEIIFENHLQALSEQICGYKSNYCQDSFKLMCGDTFMGTFACPHYLSNECDGHIDSNTILPSLIMNKNSDIKSGCTFEIFLNFCGLSIKNINIGMMSYVDIDEILENLGKNYDILDKGKDV